MQHDLAQAPDLGVDVKRLRRGAHRASSSAVQAPISGTRCVTSTGHGASCNTPIVTLPSANRARPLRAWQFIADDRGGKLVGEVGERAGRVAAAGPSWPGDSGRSRRTAAAIGSSSSFGCSALSTSSGCITTATRTGRGRAGRPTRSRRARAPSDSLGAVGAGEQVGRAFQGSRHGSCGRRGASGRSVRRMTSSATLPSAAHRRRPRPCVVMHTTRSSVASTVSLMISAA